MPTPRSRIMRILAEPLWRSLGLSRLRQSWHFGRRSDAIPTMFRFEYSPSNDVMDPIVIWMDGDDVRVSWIEPLEIQSGDRLRIALAKAAGASLGAAQAIPSLLFGHRVGGPRPTNFGYVAALDEDATDGKPCYRLHGYTASKGATADVRAELVNLLGKGAKVDGTARTLWVDRETLLIRKSEDVSDFGLMRARVTTEYTPDTQMVPSAEEPRT